MKTRLYEDTTTSELKTFYEVKNDYVWSSECDLPITDDVMLQIINENLVQNGGNIKMVKDEIIDWCNDYSEYMEADRYLNQEERDTSVKDIYESIMCNAEFLDEVRVNLHNDEEGRCLLARLDKLV